MSDDKKLRPHPAIPQNTPDKPVLVIILDGEQNHAADSTIRYSM